MIAIDPEDTIGRVLDRAASKYGEKSLIAIPATASRSYNPSGIEISYALVNASVEKRAAVYKQAGYGLGHRVALFLENQPEHIFHKLALNTIGACCVPINPDYRAAELAYLIDHSKVDLIVSLKSRVLELEAAFEHAQHRPQLVFVENFTEGLARAARQATSFTPSADTPASILYTSGTTGRPKGCVLSHRYELASGVWYATRGGISIFNEGAERLYNPLPLYHVNASILSFFGMLVSGGCQIQSDRFHPQRWWQEIRETEATIVHYLGVIIPMLLNVPASNKDLQHKVRFGIGAGVEPQLHAIFEERFGFPLVEIWGMTEIVRVLIDNELSRVPGTRAFGRPMLGLEVRVTDDAGYEVPNQTPGEMLVRHSKESPRKDFFSGYLDDPHATEAAWRGGWFHTGDIVVVDEGGVLHFVDRRKNIIRRSGENIAAAEVEALLISNPLVKNAAVLAVDDDIREEEVMAAVVLNEELSDGSFDQKADLAKTIFNYCLENLAYYKAPGWLLFVNSIPTTGTQKVQKHQIFESGQDPRQIEGIFDFRMKKKRQFN